MLQAGPWLPMVGADGRSANDPDDDADDADDVRDPLSDSSTTMGNTTVAKPRACVAAH